MLGNMIVETANNPGVSTLNLLGAATGRIAFSAFFTSGTQCYYYISDGTSFEYGIGTSTSGAPNTLSRDTVLGNSSGTTAKINFSGLVTVWNDLPAQLTFGYGTRARIDPTTGYVGFGIAAPVSHMHISGDASAGADNVRLRLTDTGASGRSVAWGTSGGVTTLRDLTGAVDYLSISAAGTMTMPALVVSQTLNVAGASAFTSGHFTTTLQVDSNYTSAGGSVTAAFVHSTGAIQADTTLIAYGAMTANANFTCSGTTTLAGTVGIGSGLQIGSGGLMYDTGGNQIGFRAGYGGSYTYFLLNNNGNGYALNGSWINVSDVITKQDIETVPNALDLVLSMRGVFYVDKATQERRAGVIGNEMIIVMPEATSKFMNHEGGELIGVNYGALSAPLIEAIRVLDARIKALEAR